MASISLRASVQFAALVGYLVHFTNRSASFSRAPFLLFLSFASNPALHTRHSNHSNASLAFSVHVARQLAMLGTRSTSRYTRCQVLKQTDIHEGTHEGTHAQTSSDTHEAQASDPLLNALLVLLFLFLVFGNFGWPTKVKCLKTSCLSISVCCSRPKWSGNTFRANEQSATVEACLNAWHCFKRFGAHTGSLGTHSPSRQVAYLGLV